MTTTIRHADFVESIAAALQYRANSTCPPLAPMTVAPLEAVSGAAIPKPAWRQNRIVRR